MFVFGRIILHKRQASAMNSGAVSVSELSTTVDAMTKLQSSDSIVVTTLNADDDDATKTKDGSIGGGGGAGLPGAAGESEGGDGDAHEGDGLPGVAEHCCVSFHRVRRVLTRDRRHCGRRRGRG